MAEKKKDNSKTITQGVAVVAAGAALWMGLAANNAEVANNKNVESQTESVINLPATNEKVNGLSTQITSLGDSINAQINRREVEMFDYIKTLFENEKRFDDVQDTRIERLEQEIFDLVPHK